MQKKRNAVRHGKNISQHIPPLRVQKSETISLHASLRQANDLNDGPISPAVSGYVHTKSFNLAHEHILDIFEELTETRNINKAFLARRLGKDPAQINRLLAAPGNWTIETYSDLLLAMGRTAVFESSPILPTSRSNECPAAHESAVYAAQTLRQGMHIVTFSHCGNKEVAHSDNNVTARITINQQFVS